MHKITCIIHSLHLGGLEWVMATLLNNFVERSNVEVSLVLIGKTRKVTFDIDEKIQVYKPNFEFNPRQRIWSTLKTMYFIRNTIQEINPSGCANLACSTS